MTGWLRYPGRLAHQVTGNPHGIQGREDRETVRGVVTTVGVSWGTICSRTLNIWLVDRPGPSADWADPLELRAERPRAFCLRCLYFASLQALVLDERSLSRFVASIEAGAMPGLVTQRTLEVLA